MRITFKSCVARASFRAVCQLCRRERTREVIVENTVNPFNKNEDGSVKSESQVWQSAYEQACARADKMDGSTEVCRPCRELPLIKSLVAWHELGNVPSLQSREIYQSHQEIWVERKCLKCIDYGVYVFTLKGRKRAEKELSKIKKDSL